MNKRYTKPQRAPLGAFVATRATKMPCNQKPVHVALLKRREQKMKLLEQARA